LQRASVSIVAEAQVRDWRFSDAFMPAQSSHDAAMTMSENR
jgi:hypothetical protein